MAFRYLIYRTDFGNTIVRESITSGTTSGSELELFTDFVIPEIQPLYLWRVTGGTDVIPNTESNINDWLNHINPPGPDDYVTYFTFTGYTAQTQTDLDGKINIVTGATGNLGEFDASGNLIDTGWQISGLTGGSGQDVYVSGMTYIGSTLTLQRTEGFPDLTASIVTSGTSDGVVSGATLSGNTLILTRTEGLPDVTADLSGLISDIEADIIVLSGAIDQNTSDIVVLSGAIDQNTTDIIVLSGAIDQNTTDITYISGITDTKLDIVTFTGYTATTDIRLDDIEEVTDIAITGVTNGLTKVGSHDAKLGGTLTELTSIDGAGFDFAMFNLDSLFLSASAATYTDVGNWGGITYSGDYSANYVDRSLVDKAYVDMLVAGLDWKDASIVATTSGETDIDLTGGTFGGTIDGRTLVDGDRVLIKNQDSAQEQNGIYDYSGGSNTFIRSEDFDGTPAGEVTQGAVTYIITGSTNEGTAWILNTEDPITVGTTPLNFVQFSAGISYVAGVGIDISGNVISFDGASVAGDNLSWSGTQLNVFGLVDIDTFTGYTAATDIRLTNIEVDISTISGDVITNTNNIAIVSAQTITNENNIITLSGDVENIYNIISGITANTVTIDEFTGYTASTDIRITNIEGDITTISGDVITLSGDVISLSGDVITLSGEVANKIDKVTGATGNLGEFTIDGNLIDTGWAISGLTGETSLPANNIQLVSTGVTDINTVLATAIDWDIVDYSGTSYLWSGGSSIYIQETGDYELSYHLTITQDGGGADKSIGTYIILNNNETLDRTSSAGSTSGNDLTEGLSINPTIFNFTAGDKLDLAGFRIGGSGTVNTNAFETVILIKKKGTLV